MPLILLGLSGWAVTGIATAVTAVVGFGGYKLTNVLQARRLKAAFEKGGRTGLREAIFEEGLASCSEHADMVERQFLGALTASPVAAPAAPTNGVSS